MANAAKSGTFKIGGELEVVRLGFGAMRITGRASGASPKTRLRSAARSTAFRTRHQFHRHADSYGPSVSEELIRETLHPYEGLVIATKAGLVRPGPGVWNPFGRPDYLIQEAHLSRRRLGVKRSICGSFTASIRTCRAANNLPP